MLKGYFYGFLEMIQVFIKGTLLESNNEKESQLRRWLFLMSLVGLPYMFFKYGSRFFATLDFTLFFHVMYVTSPVWAPLVLCSTFMHTWLRYIRTEFILKEGSVLLEIKIPQETNKSPLAMEIFFTSLFQTGSVTWIETFWKGKVRPWFSLELASIDGAVRFFIWAPKKFRNLIEAQLYAQFPTIEIHEAEDYVKWIHKPDPVNFPMWATYFKFTKPNVYPIKTYVDYGLDKDPKEEFKIDPMTSIIEYLGSMRKGEQVWIQILIQAHRKTGWKDGVLFPTHDWKHQAEHEIEKIREKSIIDRGDEMPGFPNPTKGQQETIAALERSISKFPFETAIRGMYIAKKEAFNPISITGLIGSFRQYSSNEDLNGFKLGWFTDYDYPWQDFRRMRRTRDEMEMLEAFQMRSFFQYPFKNFNHTANILNTEELATIFHFPGSVAGTPTFQRIMSKRAQAPTNLPI